MFCRLNQIHACGCSGEHTFVIVMSRTTPPPSSSPPPPPPVVSTQELPFKRSLSMETRAVDAMTGVDGAGAARRRRERRLRSWWRHERMSIACAVAEALGARTQSPEPERWRSASCTTRRGARSLLHRGRGRLRFRSCDRRHYLTS